MLLVALFIITMQYLQILQVFLSFLATLLFLVLSTINNARYSVFESKFTKVFRFFQDLSFTILMAIMCLLYLDENWQIIPEWLRSGFAIAVVVLVISNILMEFMILVREGWKYCCSRKRAKVEAQAMYANPVALPVGLNDPF